MSGALSRLHGGILTGPPGFQKVAGRAQRVVVRFETRVDTAPPGADSPLRAMSIKVCVPAPLRPYCGGASELGLAALNVRAALEELEHRHPSLYRNVCDETGAVRRHINLFVNTAHVRDREGLDTALMPGDILTILPAVSGG